MVPPISSSPEVAKLLALSNPALQRLVLAVMKESGQSSMARTRVVAAIARKKGVKQLKGSMREQFQKNVNLAIGVLLRGDPSKIIRHGTTNSAVALPKKSYERIQAPRTRLLAAIGNRIMHIRFTCIGCGMENEVTDLDKQGWCQCLTSFYATKCSSSRDQSRKQYLTHPLKPK